jgi:hypothetical protein
MGMQKTVKCISAVDEVCMWARNGLLLGSEYFLGPVAVATTMVHVTGYRAPCNHCQGDNCDHDMYSTWFYGKYSVCKTCKHVVYFSVIPLEAERAIIDTHKQHITPAPAVPALDTPAAGVTIKYKPSLPPAENPWKGKAPTC